MIDRFIGEAESSGRPVVIVGTAAASKLPVAKIESPNDARSTASALVPQPFEPDRAGALSALENALKAANSKNPNIIWLPDGLDQKPNAGDIGKKLAALAGNGTFAVLDETKGHEPLGLTARLGDKGKLQALVLSPGGPERDGTVNAYSARGERLGEAPFKLGAGAKSADVTFDLPLELRNQVARIELAGERSAGAVNLIDAATQWHRVGLISGESREEAQPLLAPLYYIEKALKPYADLAVAKNRGTSAAVARVGPSPRDRREVLQGCGWSGRRPLRGSRHGLDHPAVLEHARLQPLPEQADDPAVADPVLDEPDQPVVADRVEERPEVGVEDPVDPLPGDPGGERVQRVVLATPGPEPVAEAEELRLVDRRQDGHHRGLDDLVLQRRDAERPSPAVRLRYVPSPGRQRPVGAAVEAVVEIGEPGLQVDRVLLPGQAIDPRRRVPPLLEEGPTQGVEADMVQQRRELLLPVPRDRLP